MLQNIPQCRGQPPTSPLPTPRRVTRPRRSEGRRLRSPAIRQQLTTTRTNNGIHPPAHRSQPTQPGPCCERRDVLEGGRAGGLATPGEPRERGQAARLRMWRGFSRVSLLHGPSAGAPRQPPAPRVLGVGAGRRPHAAVLSSWACGLQGHRKPSEDGNRVLSIPADVC